ILNLCVNARDAMPNGGILTIETYNKDVLEGELPFSWARPGRYAVIRVTDTGTGMDEEVKKHIFEPFFTTKGIGKGTGMGLAMVYGVVKNHNGFITVDSEPGKGSIFTIYLPASEIKTEEKMEEIRTPITGTGTILIVDDEEATRNLLSDALSGLGYNTIEASNGREAIDFYLSNRDTIDLVILDLIMPVMGGEETLIKLREINPDVKVLIATGYGVSETLNEILRDRGINGFINKPFNIAEISEMIKTVLSTG
ncbi:MAG: response regulator, partial [Thermodesulfovibrionales bacterium]